MTAICNGMASSDVRGEFAAVLKQEVTQTYAATGPDAFGIDGRVLPDIPAALLGDELRRSSRGTR